MDVSARQPQTGACDNYDLHEKGGKEDAGMKTPFNKATTKRKCNGKNNNKA